jgi:propanediol dehydratase small subunit
MTRKQEEKQMSQVDLSSISSDLIAEAVRRTMEALSQNQGQPTTVASAPKTAAAGLDAKKDYPLGIKRSDLVQSNSGLSLSDIELAKVTNGQITFQDIKIRPETLEYQAQIAESIGRPHLAANLRRAAEMTRIPDERVLEMYNSLRPYRSTKQELMEMAQELESKYDARICAALVREAAQIYEKRDRLKK